MKQHTGPLKSQQQGGKVGYPGVFFVFRGSGGRLRHVGVAVGSVEGAEGRRGPVGRRGQRDDVPVGITAEDKAAEGVAVGQDDHSLHQLSQRPALLAQQRLREQRRGEPHQDAHHLTLVPRLRLPYLDVGAGGEPGPVSQHLVDVVEKTQARGRALQTVQPQGVPAHPQEMSRVELDQVVAVVSRRSLKGSQNALGRQPPGANVWRAFTHHDGDVMAVWQREGAVHVQDVVLRAQEALQVLRVRGHLLGHGVHAACADQCLGEEQRHALLLSIHHHLRGPDGRMRNTQLQPTRLRAAAQGRRGDRKGQKHRDPAGVALHASHQLQRHTCATVEK